MDFKVVIPARHGSTRLPGKPLLEIAGKPLIRHVCERARESRAGEIVVATDDGAIAAVCGEFGVDVQLTSAAHLSGSDRIAEVVEARGWPGETLIVNLQGDEPCMPGSLIDQVAENLAHRVDVGMATLAHPIADRQTLLDPHIVKVVTDVRGMALYFSRAPVPWHRDEFLRSATTLPSGVPFLRHIGLYAFRADFLRRYVAWAPAPLELAESLEQLRVLWYGEGIHVGIATNAPGPGVDTAGDLERAGVWLAARAGV